MKEEAILHSIQELEKWEKRKDEILHELKCCPKEIKQEKKNELDKADEQILYYRKLIAEMKKETSSVRIRDILDGLR